MRYRCAVHTYIAISTYAELANLQCTRLASEAAAAPLEAADVDSDCFDPYDARGSKAVRRPPNQARSSAHRPMRRPAPSRVSLLSRSLPEDRQSMLTSAFAASESQVNPHIML